MNFQIVDQEGVNWIRALVSVASVYFVVTFLYCWFTDPLRSIPGPFLARLTGAWVVFLELSGHRSTTIRKLHKKYGPVVRLSPTELSFDSPQALKEIYSANSKYPKAPVYDSLGFLSTFTTRNKDDYRVMKKRIVPSFSPAAVAELEPIVHRQISNLLKCFDKRVDTPLDVLPWFRMLALGVVGEGFAQDSFGGLENEKTPELLEHIHSVFPTLWVWWMFPMTSKMLQYSPFSGVRRFLKAAEEFRKFTSTAYDRYLASFDPRDHHDLLARMINERSALQEKSQRLPRHITERGIVDELTNLIFAGTDTTSNTLTYLFWDLANHPEWQMRLRDELSEAIGDATDFEYKDISELPVVEAVVQETLRLQPAGPSSLQRLVPEGGSVIDGVAVPAQVIVSSQSLSSQREPSIFPDPDSFNPQRWIDGEKAGTVEEMREQMMVFGKGARACLGRRLATMELKCTVAALVRRFNFSIGSPTTDDDMDIMCHFVIIPKGGKCILRLSRV